MGLIDMSFAENLKNKLHALGITQTELSKRTGINKAIISEYISGKYEPKQKNLFKIATALNIKPSELISDFAEPSAPAQELSDHDKNMVAAYNAAPASTQRIVDVALEPFMPKEHSDDGKADFEEEGA